MPHEPATRLRQLRRTLLIIELLAPLRYGATLSEIADDVREEIGIGYCDRTILRDLESLEQFGLVEYVHGSRRWPAPMVEQRSRWQWADQSIRGVIYRHTAERQALADEADARVPAIA